ncbi:MAG: hypothetical protein ACRDPY_48580 [Streptosporangiaceae bacterium]
MPYSATFFAAGVPAYSPVNAPSWLGITQFGAVTRAARLLWRNYPGTELCAERETTARSE